MEQKTNNRKERKKSSIDLSTMVYGKVPPQAKELEEAVLGAILEFREAMDEVATILSPESFYVDAHQRIFRAFQALANRNTPIDILMTVNQLKTTEELEVVGGPYYITTLTNKVTSFVNTQKFAKIIQQKFIQREMIRIAGEIIGDAYEDSTDVFDLLDHAEQSFLSIGTKHLQGDTLSMEQVVMETVKEIHETSLLDSPITGVPSGIPSLDRATRGWQPGLIVIGARPSVGKTAFALKLAKEASQNEIRSVPVAIWSLEMDAKQQVKRMMADDSQITLYQIQTGRLDASEMQRISSSASNLAAKRIFFDDSTDANITSLRAKARRLKKRHNIGLIILDYLQLLGGDGERGNREQEIARISRSLKKLSKELNIPIIALSQMSRDIEKRPGKERTPKASDLRESGAIEQDADVIIMLWGPEDEEVEATPELKNRRYAKIVKQRDGVLLKVDLDFKTSTQTITEHQLESQWKKVEIPKVKTGDLFQSPQNEDF